jgi:hypothetical protein
VDDIQTYFPEPTESSSVNQMTILLLLITQLLQPQDASLSLDDVMVRSRTERDQASLCGPLSMARVMSIHGRSVQFDAFLARFDRRTAEGVQLSEMIAIGDEIGFPLQAVEFPSRKLNEIPLPGILLVDGDAHCLVLENVNEHVVTVWDPSAMVSTTLPVSLIATKWSGKALLAVRRESQILAFSCGGVLFFIGLCLLWRSRRHGASNAQ